MVRKFEAPKTTVLEVTYAYEGMPKLEYVGDISDCIDLYTAEDVTIKQGEFKLIDLGVIIKAPEGYRINLMPRSSTFKKYGIIQTNSIGIIDNSYVGPEDIYRMPAFKLTEGEITIPKHTRLCQIELVPVAKADIVVEVSMDEVIKKRTSRGGFGSTGN